MIPIGTDVHKPERDIHHAFTNHISLGSSFSCLLVLAGRIAVAKDPPVASVSPEVALARLKEGNARFVAQAVSAGKPTAARRAETAQTQAPFAIIVGCADSRTAPELVFDQNLGDLFVVRTAGNLVDDHGLGSIEYAVDHLGTRLIVVLGHSRCGAVKAALESPPRRATSIRWFATSSRRSRRRRAKRATRWPMP